MYEPARGDHFMRPFLVRPPTVTSATMSWSFTDRPGGVDCGLGLVAADEQHRRLADGLGVVATALGEHLVCEGTARLPVPRTRACSSSSATATRRR
jgi:hypothetical protein